MINCLVIFFNSDLVVVAGAHDINDPRNEIIRTISKVDEHPNYSEQINDYDFAILFLKEPMPSDSRAIPACLPPSSWNEEFLVGKDLTISGWGETDESGSPSTVLQSAIVTAVSNSKCQNLYDNIMITDQMICAGNLDKGGVDACRGDGGGNTK